MERQYYNTRLQFLDIRMQMLQEELDLLHTQRDYLVQEHKDMWQMTAQEIDEIIKELVKKQAQAEEIQKKYEQLLADTPDTDENAQQRDQYHYSMRLAQVRLQSIVESIESARQQKYRNQMQSPTPAKPIPKSYGDNYPSSVFHKEVPKKASGAPWDQIPTIPIYSTEPHEVEERRKKIQPSLPTYGYVSRQEKLHRPTARKTYKTYQHEEMPEWTNLPLSAMEYVNRKYPPPPSDDAKVEAQPLYRKFNMDGLNDYCQMVVKTGYQKQHEVLLIMSYLGKPDGWESIQNPMHILIKMAADFVEMLQAACNAKLSPACKDRVHPKTVLFHNSLEKGCTLINLTIRPERGPHGQERIVLIEKEHRFRPDHDATLKLPWIQLPKFLHMVSSVMSEYEFTPVDLQGS
jgi:hypothetical protein